MTMYDLGDEDRAGEPILSFMIRSVRCMAWSVDGRWIATGGKDTYARCVCVCVCVCVCECV